MIKFNATRDELDLIVKIAERAVALAATHKVDYDQLTAIMDINACHSNGCALRLDELLGADDANFAHDVFGIRRFMDRKTGNLGDCFLPRSAQ